MATKSDWQSAAEYLANHVVGQMSAMPDNVNCIAHMLWLYTEKVNMRGEGPRAVHGCVAEAIRVSLDNRTEAFRAGVDAAIEANRDQWQARSNKLYDEMREKRAVRETATA